MVAKLFVGSLSWGVNDEQLKEFFASVGTVVSASVIMDHQSGRSKGFGFVEMSSDAEAQEAIEQLNGKELDGRAVVVSEPRPKEDKPRNSYGNTNPSRGNNSSGGRRY